MPAHSTPISCSYFVVMVDYGRKGMEANVSPEMTRRGAIERVREALGDHLDIAFVHEIEDYRVIDITAEITAEAEAFEVDPFFSAAEQQAARFDHARDHRKNEVL